MNRPADGVARRPPGLPCNIFEPRILNQRGRGKLRLVASGFFNHPATPQRRLVLLEDLLSQVVLQSQLFDLMQLRFDPVDVMFLVDDDMFEQLPGCTSRASRQVFIPGLRTVSAACSDPRSFSSEL